MRGSDKLCSCCVDSNLSQSPYQNVNFKSGMTCGDILAQVPEAQRQGTKSGLAVMFSGCCTDRITVCNVPSEDEDANISGSMGNGKGSVPTMLSVVLFSSLLTLRS